MRVIRACGLSFRIEISRWIDEKIDGWMNRYMDRRTRERFV